MNAPSPDVHFVGPFPPIKGGVSQHGERLVQAMRDRGLEVDVTSWRNQYPRLLYPGREVRISRDLRTHTLAWWSPWSWVKTQRRVRDSQLVLIPYVSPVQVVPLKTILRRASGYRLAIVHNAIPHERIPFDTQALRWLVRSVDGVIAHSESVAETVRGLRSDLALAVVPHPPNIPIAFSPLPEGPVRLLYFGYIRPYKGVDLLISALGQLSRSGRHIELTIAGESWTNPSDLVDLARREGVAHLVDFRFGYVPDEDVDSLVSEHHLVVQPYRSASQSGVVPLAFAAGRGVVVTPVGGLSEFVQSGHNGVVATDVSAASLASAISTAVEQVATLSSGALESTTSWDALAREVLGFADW